MNELEHALWRFENAKAILITAGEQANHALNWESKCRTEFVKARNALAAIQDTMNYEI